MATPKQAVTSLLTEHFRYTPLTLLDDIINTVNELIYRAVTAVEEGLSSTPASSLGFADKAAAEGRRPEPNNQHSSDSNGERHPGERYPKGVRYPQGDEHLYPESRLEIENGVHQLETLLQATVDKNFDKLEIYVLRNILSVPEELAPWIRLGHYDNLTFPPAPQTQNPPHPQPTLETLHTLRRKLTETRKLHAALVAERARNEAYISHLRALLLPPATTTLTTPAQEATTTTLSFLPAPPSATALGVTLSPSAKTPLTTHTTELVSQLPALRQLLLTLRPYGADPETLQYDRSSSVAEERREYIETQIRRRMDQEGLDLREENLALGTRAAGMGDVAGIERVVRLVGRGREGGGERMEE